MSEGKRIKAPRVVFMGRFNSSGRLSGPEKTANRIFTEHSKTSKTWFIEYFFDGTRYSIFKKMLGISKQGLNDNAEVYTAGLFKTYQILKEIKPDIIHIVMYERFAIMALLYKLFNPVKIIYNEHGVTAYENSQIKKTNFFYNLKDKFCEKRFLKHSDKVIFVSKQSLEIAERYYSINESKIIIMANGIDQIFCYTGEKQTPLKPKAVLYYGNELYKSGYDFLTKFMDQFKPGIEVSIISDKDLTANFKTFKPMDQHKLAEFYKDKHIFFALNSYDTFSISTAEAMASGLVPIATNETGISRFIENGYNGYTINYGNTEELKNAVESYIAMSPSEKISISKNAAEIFGELKWSNIYSSYKNIYTSLMNENIM